MVVVFVVRSWKVELCLISAELNGSSVVGPCGLLGRVECAEPHPRGPPRVSNLGRPFPPRPLPDPPEFSLHPPLLLIPPLLITTLVLLEVVASQAPNNPAHLARVATRKPDSTRSSSVIKCVVVVGGRGPTTSALAEHVGERRDDDGVLLLDREWQPERRRIGVGSEHLVVKNVCCRGVGSGIWLKNSGRRGEGQGGKPGQLRIIYVGREPTWQPAAHTVLTAERFWGWRVGKSKNGCREGFKK